MIPFIFFILFNKYELFIHQTGYTLYIICLKYSKIFELYYNIDILYDDVLYKFLIVFYSNKQITSKLTKLFIRKRMTNIPKLMSVTYLN